MKDPQQLRYGVPVRWASMLQLRAGEMRDIERPVFFLSTGRCGTLFFTELLSRDRRLNVLHAPQPAMDRAGRAAWDALDGSHPAAPGSREWNALGEMFLAAREPQLVLTYRAGRRYVETNNWITFFAPFIAEVLPSAVFVHVHRHPGEFVRSGIRREWYTEGNLNDPARPVPAEGTDDAEAWGQFNDVQRIAWLWRETNRFIDRFRKEIDPERVIRLSINTLDAAGVDRVLEFVLANVPPRHVRRLLSAETRPNRQKEGSFPTYDHWDNEEKQRLREICGELAGQYGYEL